MVAVVLALLMLGGTLPAPLYVIWGPRFGFGSLMTTVLFVAYAVGTIVALVVLGSVSDRSGRRPLLLAAVAVTTLSTILFITATGVPALLCARVLSGIATGVTTTTATAALAELVPRRPRLSSTVAAAANLGGLALGPTLAGALAQHAPQPTVLVFVLYLLALVPATIALLLVVPETVEDRQRLVLRLRRPALPADGADRRAFTGAAAGLFAGFAVTGFFASLVPAFLRADLGQRDLGVVGLVVGLLFAVGMLAQIIASASTSAASSGARGGVVAAGSLVAGLAVLEAGLITRQLDVFVVGTVLAGVGFGLVTLRGVSTAQRVASPGARADVVATAFTAAYLGTSATTVGLGVLDGIVGQTVATLVVAGVAAAAAVGAVVLPHVGRASARTDPEGAQEHEQQHERK